MIRLILRETDAGAAAHDCGPVITKHKTFDVNLPDVETWLTAIVSYGHREFVGIELLSEKSQ